jgi:uncharacterized membrane protein
MVLEMKVPHGENIAALAPLWPVFASYVLSFVYVGIYWNNHHHLMQASTKISGGILWANLHLLFWLTLLPFTTGWMGENHFARWPTFLYGLDLLACAVAYYVLQTGLARLHGAGSTLVTALGRDAKGKLSPLFYLLGLAATWSVSAWAGLAIFVGVAMIWLIPDRRFERLFAASGGPR